MAFFANFHPCSPIYVKNLPVLLTKFLIFDKKYAGSKFTLLRTLMSIWYIFVFIPCDFIKEKSDFIVQFFENLTYFMSKVFFIYFFLSLLLKND